MPVSFALLAVSTLSAGTPITDVSSMFAAMRLQSRTGGLTGVMAFDGAGFCMYLEGCRDAVMHCHEAIGADSRHAEHEAISHGDCDTRRFADFRCGYAAADGLPASEQLRPLQGDTALQAFMALTPEFDLAR